MTQLLIGLVVAILALYLGFAFLIAERLALPWPLGEGLPRGQAWLRGLSWPAELPDAIWPPKYGRCDESGWRIQEDGRCRAATTSSPCPRKRER